MKISAKDFRVRGGDAVNLRKWPTIIDPVYKSKQHYQELLQEHVAHLSALQQLLYASNSSCCMDRRCGRTEPDPCSGSCDADILRASQLQHSVQHVGSDRHLDRLSPVRLRTEPITDDALPARDIALHQGAPVVP